MMTLFSTKRMVKVGGETFEPNPLSLDKIIELTLLIAPYIALVEDNLGEFKQALRNTQGERPRLLFALLSGLSDKIKPADVTRIFAILLDKPPEWFKNVKPIELVQALPILDDINNFAGLLGAIQELGINVKYRKVD